MLCTWCFSTFKAFPHKYLFVLLPRWYREAGGAVSLPQPGTPLTQPLPGHHLPEGGQQPPPRPPPAGRAGRDQGGGQQAQPLPDM